MSSQTRAWSFVESVTATLIGLATAYVTQILVFPAMGIHVDQTTHLSLVAIFTGVSVVRGYLVRRLFVWIG